VEPGQNTVTNPFSILERFKTASTWSVRSMISLKPLVLKEIVCEKVMGVLPNLVVLSFPPACGRQVEMGIQI
jgi:hypothetical protein